MSNTSFELREKMSKRQLKERENSHPSKVYSSLLLFIGLMVFVNLHPFFGQTSGSGNENEEEIIKEIISIFDSTQEQGLINWGQKNKEKINNQLLRSLGTKGVTTNNEQYLKASLILSKEFGDEKSIAEAYYLFGHYFYGISEGQKAMDSCAEALPIYKKLNDDNGQGKIFLIQAKILSYSGENQKALELFNKALGFFEKANNILGQGDTYLGIGEVYLFTGDNQKALEFFAKALPLYEKAQTPLGQGNIYLRFGDIHLYNYENEESLEDYEKALGFYREIEDFQGISNVYRGMGDIYFNKGDKNKALEMYDEAREFAGKAFDFLGQGNVLYKLGDLYYYTSEIQNAMGMYEKALAAYEKVGYPIGQGNVYWRLGDIYIFIGDHEKASQMYDDALPFFKKAEEPTGQANVLISKGNMYLSLGNRDEALNMYQQALPFYEQTEDVVGKADAFYKLGDIFFEEKKNQEAFDMYTKALQLYDKAGNLVGLGNAYLGLGNYHFQNGDRDKAWEMYNKSESFYNKRGDIEQEANTLFAKAAVLAKEKKHNNAADLYQKVIINLEKVRIKTGFHGMKKKYFQTVYKKYEDITVYMLEHSFYDRAFKIAESMKARIFLDQLAEGLVDIEKGINPVLKKQRDSLVTKLSLLSKTISEAENANEQAILEKLNKEYSQSKDELEELLMKIRLENPRYASVKYPEPINIKVLQNKILNEEELLLEYFVSGNAVYAFLITKTSFKILKLPSAKKDIESLLEIYLPYITWQDDQKENRSREKNRLKYGDLLYKMLIKPFEPDIETKKIVIIVPDGEFVKLPFETLAADVDEQLRKPTYWLQKSLVKYVQSASVLAILREQYKKEGTSDRFIGFGDPVYKYEESIKPGVTRGNYLRAGGHLTPLPGSGEEVKKISQVFKKCSKEYQLKLRLDAREENARAPQMKNYGYIHFSCHGILGSEFQCLALSQIPGSGEDGYLTLEEIMNCDYNARLVVLSACKTGEGKMERGEGVTGLTRAIMYAGAPATVVSLWNVHEIGTKELMIRFYENLIKKNMDKVEAFQKAKLEMLSLKKFSSPYYWGAFVMYGE